MSKQKLLVRVAKEIRRRNYSYKTEKAYTSWIQRYIRFNNTSHPLKLNEKDIVAFLNWLATERNVTASTQNQALCAIIMYLLFKACI